MEAPCSDKLSPVLGQGQPEHSVTRACWLQVEVERVKWLAPPGLAGFMPLASVGPVSVGPGPVERSSVRAEEVLVGIDPLRSAVQRELVLTFTAKKPEASAGSSVVEGF